MFLFLLMNSKLNLEKWHKFFFCFLFFLMVFEGFWWFFYARQFFFCERCEIIVIDVCFYYVCQTKTLKLKHFNLQLNIHIYIHTFFFRVNFLPNFVVLILIINFNLDFLCYYLNIIKKNIFEIRKYAREKKITLCK